MTLLLLLQLRYDLRNDRIHGTIQDIQNARRILLLSIDNGLVTVQL